MTLYCVTLECIWNNDEEIAEMENKLNLKIVEMSKFIDCKGGIVYMFIGHYHDIVDYILNYYGTDDEEMMREEIKSIQVFCV